MDNRNELNCLSADFKTRYDAFALGCENADRDGHWNTEENGPIEGYAFSALTGAILSLMVADGNVGERETEYLDRTFGFDYSVDDLLALFRFSARDLRENAVANVKDAAEKIHLADEALAGSFAELLSLACRILSESDDGVQTAESDLIRSLEEAARK